MTYPPAAKLIECNVEADGREKWFDFVDGGNGFLYGIPYNASKVVEFNTKDESIKEIGPDLGDATQKYGGGVRAENGSIYCIPYYGMKSFLKITPFEGGGAEVRILDDKLPEEGYFLWKGGALAQDGCIYYMPLVASRILKLDPSNDDSISLVGEALLQGWAKYTESILENDNCIYGIPFDKRIQTVKFNPVLNTICYVYIDLIGKGNFSGGVLASDGNIYTANSFGQVVKIDVDNNKFAIFGSKMYHGCEQGWGKPVVGADMNIYFPPLDHVLWKLL